MFKNKEHKPTSIETGSTSRELSQSSAQLMSALPRSVGALLKFDYQPGYVPAGLFDDWIGPSMDSYLS